MILAQQLLVLLAALAAAATVAVTARQVALAPREGKALAAYRADAAAPAVEVDINRGLGLVKPAYARYLYLLAVAGVVGVLLLAGMPLAPALGGGALAYVLADEFLKGGPRKARLAIEQELPTFVSRLGGMLLVTGSRAAVEEITATLLEGQPLRTWLERLLSGWQSQGEAFLAQAHLEANQISPLLGLTVYQIRRLAETGGAGATKAFATTAEELSAILEARGGQLQGAGARQSVLTMLVIMAVILAIMLASPVIRQGYRDPTAQLVAAGALAVMGFGYVTLNDMIAEALEG